MCNELIEKVKVQRTGYEIVIDSETSWLNRKGNHLGDPQKHGAVLSPRYSVPDRIEASTSTPCIGCSQSTKNTDRWTWENIGCYERLGANFCAFHSNWKSGLREYSFSKLKLEQERKTNEVSDRHKYENHAVCSVATWTAHGLTWSIIRLKWGSTNQQHWDLAACANYVPR